VRGGGRTDGDRRCGVVARGGAGGGAERVLTHATMRYFMENFIILWVRPHPQPTTSSAPGGGEGTVATVSGGRGRRGRA
jgi:hypothetical protein